MFRPDHVNDSVRLAANRPRLRAIPASGKVVQGYDADEHGNAEHQKSSQAYLWSPGSRVGNWAINLRLGAHSIRSFPFAASLVCHCMFSGLSVPPRFNGTM